MNNWEALQTLKDFYGLADSREQEKEEIRRHIELQQQEERRREERKQAFYAALSGEIDRLKRWEDICKLAIEKAVFEPFSDTWAYCVNELQKTEYRLDILCVVFQIKRAANLQIILAPYKIDVVLQPHYPETLLHITRTKILPCKLIAQEYSVSSYENGSSSSSIWQA